MTSVVAKFRPLVDRVLVQKVVQKTQTSTGIFLPDTVKSGINEAKVISTGPGRVIDGVLQKVELQAGDHVVLPEYGGMAIKFDNEEYHIFRAEDIIGVMDK